MGPSRCAVSEHPAPPPPGGPALPGDITGLLVRARSGDPADLDALFDAVYQRLKDLARQRLRGSPALTLDATTLVHEAFLRFAGADRLEFRDRQHFFAVAAKAMRQIVVDRARRRHAAKRGSGAHAVPLDDAGPAGEPVPIDDVLAIDAALHRLAALSPRLVQVVELCHFAGLTTEEAAEVLGVTSRTIKREWQKARLLLASWLGGPGGTAATAGGTDPGR